jgi:hypothetical protein
VRKSITRAINRTLLPFTANFNPSQLFILFYTTGCSRKFEIKEKKILFLIAQKQHWKKNVVFGGCRSDGDYGGGSE